MRWWGSSKRRSADALADEADRLAMAQPGSSEALAAAQRSLAAAEPLEAGSYRVDDQRRLARALWRMVSAHLLAEDFETAAEYAQRCWTKCHHLLRATERDPKAFDEVAGLVVWWCGALGPALVIVGRQDEADRMSDTVVDVAARAQGPRGRQARARQVMGQLASQLDEGFLDPPALRDAIDTGLDAVRVLRDHAHEGPYEASDVARMLHVVSRLHGLAGWPALAAASLDEAVAVAAPIAGKGPNFAKLLRDLKTARATLPTA